MNDNISRPDEIVESIKNVNFKNLFEKNLFYLILDVDNTICFPKRTEPEDGIADKLKEALSVGFLGVCLVSNTIMAKKEDRIYKIASNLEKSLGIERASGKGIKVICAGFREQKPRSKPFKKALGKFKTNAEYVVAIGDQITDVRGANQCGIYTILVKPLSEDGFFTKISLKRAREKRILKKLNINVSW